MSAPSAATYTVPEAAALLGISRGAAYRLARSEKLPGVLKLGSRYVVGKAALDSYLFAMDDGDGAILDQTWRDQRAELMRLRVAVQELVADLNHCVEAAERTLAQGRSL